MVCSMGQTPRMRAVTSLMRVHQLVPDRTRRAPAAHGSHFAL